MSIAGEKPELERGNARTASLLVQRADGWKTSVDLELGASLMVGSSSACGLRLEGDNLSGIHCLLRIENERLTVHDWCSQTGSLVNGQRIEDETVLGAGDRLRIGDYEFSLHYPRGSTRRDETPDVSAELDQETFTEVDQPRDETQPSLGHPSDVSQDPLEAATHSPPTAAPARPGPAPLEFDPDLSPTEETIELLRAELELLQFELADRDAQIAEHASQVEDNFAPRDDAHDSHLLARLDELLEELVRSDQRATQLEAMLRASEESSRAVHEERAHIESWISDIERRVKEKAGEWTAENELLQQRCADAEKECARLEQALSGSRDSDESEAQKQVISSLQQRGAALQAKLTEAEAECRRLKTELGKCDRESVADEVRAELREENLKIAQERAALARQRTEVLQLCAEREPPEQRADTEIDKKLRVFREHLREIHVERDDTDTAASGRLSKLWQWLSK